MATATTSPAVESVSIRANMVDSLTEYYPKESKNTSLYFLLSAYSDTATDADTERADTILDVGVDESRAAALYRNLGYFYDLPIRGDFGWDWTDYRFMLKVLNEAWTLYGSTQWRLRRVVQVATEISPTIFEHYKYAGWILGKYTLGVTVLVQTGDSIWNSMSNLYLSTASIYGVWPRQQTNVWLCGIDAGAGEIWYSDYGGAGIGATAGAPLADAYYAIHGVGPQEVWACGEVAGDGIVSHWHHMHGWDSVVGPYFIGDPLRGIWMNTPSDGWVVGGSVTGVVHSWNGTVWGPNIPAGPPPEFHAVHGVGAIVYAVGDNGAVYRWDGAVWANRSTGVVAVDLRGVNVIDANTAWVCGTSGNVYYTDNGGASWANTSLGGGADDLFGIWASTDGTDVRVVGDNGAFFYSSDSGASWGTETYQGSGQALRCIYMRPNGTMGFICGDAGTLLRRNGQSPGYTLYDGTYLANGDLIYGAILESRLGRRNSVDVVVWNMDDYNLLWRFLNEMKPAHIKLYLIHEVPFASGYYYYDYYDPYLGAQTQTFDGETIEEGTVVNGRAYGPAMSRIVTGESEIHIPPLS